MIDRLLFQHPRSVGESYAEHAAVASRIGARMMLGGVACLVHAIVPSLCVRTGSTTIKQLYAEMKAAPGKYSYATSGVGTVLHLAMELLKQRLDAAERSEEEEGHELSIRLHRHKLCPSVFPVHETSKARWNAFRCCHFAAL